MPRVLVVNDLGFVRHQLSTLLKQLGHDAISVGDGEAALARLRRDFQISDVLTDLALRGMNAVEVLNASRAIVRLTDSGENASGPRIWVLASIRDNMIPGFPNVELDVAAAQLGFAGVLIKPVSMDSLQAAISSSPGPPSSKSKTANALAAPIRGILEQQPSSGSLVPDASNAVATLTSFGQLLKKISGKTDTTEQILATIDRELQRIAAELQNRG